ncbi:uncharacterized protein LOC141665410 [Apium graveolens]|uniref:uncharacterized protein LOC141665410 n=1 Tax=Apium graveolens TaxID=4045 RepID=UPI003D7A9789
MNCVSWNCRGLGKPRTVRVLCDLVKDRNPDILFLSETISVSRKIEELRIKMGYDSCFSVDKVGRSGGLAVFWRNSARCNITGYSRSHIDLVFLENNVEVWHLSCFYGFPDRARRKESWNLIRALSRLSPLPWCIIGDFNDLLYNSDKQGVHPHPNALMEGFRKAVDDSELCELDLLGGLFTWEKSRGKDDWVRERLDRAFANMSWWARFPLCKLKVIVTPVSDHDPI